MHHLGGSYGFKRKTITGQTCGGQAGGRCMSAGFGTPAGGTATGRQVQFGLKFLF